MGPHGLLLKQPCVSNRLYREEPFCARFPHARPLSCPNIMLSLVCTWGFQNNGYLVHSINVSGVCLTKWCCTWHHAYKMEFVTLSSSWQAILGGTLLVQHQFKESCQDLPYLGVPACNLLWSSTFQHPLPSRRQRTTILASILYIFYVFNVYNTYSKYLKKGGRIL